MTQRRQKSTQQQPRRPGKVIAFRPPIPLPSAPKPAEGQRSFDFMVVEEQEGEDSDE
jgi:hypothetical protein